MRLRELEETGFVNSVENQEPTVVRWPHRERKRYPAHLAVHYRLRFKLCGIPTKSSRRRSRTLDELFEPEAVQIIQIHLKGVQPNTPRNYQDLKLQECWMKVS